MNLPIITTQSAYWLLLILGIASSLTYFVYYKKLILTDLSKSKTVFLSSIRFLLLTLIGILLLSPIIKTATTETKKPIIIFAQDNSMSMVLSKDSTYLRDTFPHITSNILNKLSNNYDVRTIQFGDTISNLNYTFDEKESNIEILLNEFNTTYFNQNIGALIVASDGLFNKGINPIYASQNLSFPIYTIPFGDTVPSTDLSIKKIEYNKIAYKGTKFPIVVSVFANSLKGKQVVIKIFNGNKVLQSETVDIDNNTFFKKIPFHIKADTSGIFKYVIKALVINTKETNTLNNIKNIYVEVEDNKRKILILQDGYHPDIAVFKQIINVNPVFDVEVFNVRNFKANIRDYALVILYQLPTNTNSLHSILPKLLKNDIPMLFVVGKKTSIDAINNLNLLLNIKQQTQLYNNVLPKLNTEFTLFNLLVDNNMMIDLPPMVTPFGVYKNIPSNQVLLFQQIGDITTQNPLWTFIESGKQKIGFILGEGIWKWRLQEYKKYRDHSITNELVTKSINYLALKNRVNPFVIEYLRTVKENRDVVLKAKLYNASNEFIKEASVNIDVFNSDGIKYQYIFKETLNGYSVNLGNLNLGKYNFTASTKLDNKLLVKKGAFIVTDNNIEQSNLLADYNILHRLAARSNGKLFYRNQVLQIINHIKSNNNIASVTYLIKDVKQLISIKWVFICLLLLVGVEWFFRKYWGVV